MPAQKTKTDIGTRAPVNPIGGVIGGALVPQGMSRLAMPWSTWHDVEEFVPELTWPRSVRTYYEMSTDSQLSALYKATTLGVMKFKWSIDPNGCPDEQVSKLSQDYNLPVLGEKVNQRYRAKRRFAFIDHMRKAFKSGIYGHYYFEQLGEIAEDGKWHLRKLAERPPATIQDFRIAEDGGLISIIQNVPKGGSYWGELPEIPIDRMVGYVWDQEGSNWAGKSWFRACYKNWVIKDRLLRIDAINHERAGGVPYIEAHPGASFAEIEQLNQMAQGFRIGDTSGGAVPSGAKLVIAKGTNSSVVESIKYHDEAMARDWMLMIMQLGMTESGSRALGKTFIDFWGHGLETIGNWFKDIFNEHVIEDDIDWNWGEDVEKVPLLTFEFDPEFSAVDLKDAVSSGAIEVDDELEAYIRKEMGLPDKGTPRLGVQQEAQLEMQKTQMEQDAQMNKDSLEVQKQKNSAQPSLSKPKPGSGSQRPAAKAGTGDAEGAPSRHALPANTDEEED
jgi:hypothetical protein